MKLSTALNRGLKHASQHRDKSWETGLWLKVNSRGKMTGCAMGLMYLGMTTVSNRKLVAEILKVNPLPTDLKDDTEHPVDDMITLKGFNTDKEMDKAFHSNIEHPVTKQKEIVAMTLGTLNDDHQWTAAKILKWLKSQQL